MAELVGAYAASHGPLIVRAWDAIPADERRRLQSAYEEIGRRIAIARPDVIVVVAPDHWSNFSLDHFPSVCIGVGESNAGPPEPWMKACPWKEIPGDAGLGAHLVQSALDAGFEPSFSHRLRLDHGFCIPLWKMGLPSLPRIVPIVVNSIEPPMPSVRRCLEWGSLL